MIFHARRLVADLRGFRLWAVVLVLMGFLAAFVSAMATGDLDSLTGGEAPGPSQHGDVSYLRVLDPDESPTQTFESIDQLTQSTLDEPGLVVLMNAMGADDRMFIVLYLQAFTDHHIYGGSVESGIGVIGARPAWLPVDVSPERQVLLWGEMPAGAPGVDDTRFGELPVLRMSEGNISAHWPGTRNLAYAPGADAIVLFHPELARRAGIGVASTRLTDVLGGFTCACSVNELTPVAAEMTSAERAAGTRRVYYAIDHDDSVGPTVHSRRAGLGLSAVALCGIAVGFLVFEHAGAVEFFRRRRRDYGIEHRAGAPAWSLQLRQQVTFFAVVTAPIVGGVWLEDVLFESGSPSPAPWHGDIAVVALVIGAAVQTIVGLRPFVGLRRDLQPTTTGGKRV